MNLRAIRSELALACGGRGLTVYDELPGAPNLPAVIVGWPESIRYNATLAGGHAVRLRIELVVGLSDLDEAQSQLDDLISGDLAASLMAHPSHLWQSIDVPSVENIGTETTGVGEVILAELVVDLITTP